jgi:hypothetical protein
MNHKYKHGVVLNDDLSLENNKIFDLFAIFGIISLLYFSVVTYGSKYEINRYIANNCHIATKTIGITKEKGWQCKDGCFYYRIQGGFVCFKD